MNILSALESLLKKFTFRSKFLFTGVVLLSPFLLVSYLYHSEIKSRIVFTQSELKGTTYLPSIKDLYVNIAAHRGMTQAFLNGDASLSGKLNAAKQKVDNAFIALNEVNQQDNNQFDLSSVIAQAERTWQSIEGDTQPSPSQSFETHTKAISQVHTITSKVADKSNLILDPEVESYYAMHIVTSLLPGAIESIGVLRGKGTGIISSNTITESQMLEMSSIIGGMIDDVEDFKHSLESVKNHSGAFDHFDTNMQAFSRSLSEFYQLSQKQLLGREFSISPSVFFDKGTATIQAALAVYQDVSPELTKLLNTRLDKSLNQEKMLLLLLALSTIVSSLLFYAMYTSIRRSVSDLSEAAVKVSEGDLTHRIIDYDGKDEFKDIYSALGSLITKLQAITLEIKEAGKSLDTVGEDIYSASSMAADNCQSQANEISSVAASMQEMSSSIQEVANNSGEASQSAEQSVETVVKGLELINSTESSIVTLSNEIKSANDVVGQLEQDSEGIYKIVDAIKDIADQTNLLALNAAIEAARAGEQGRGFAVVADEVRALAKRTQESTSEIQGMLGKIQGGSKSAAEAIGMSTEYAQECVTNTQAAAEYFDTIMKSANSINDTNILIASATEQQSAVSNDVNEVVERIQSSASTTLEQSQQTVSKSLDVKKVSANLQELLAFFRLKAD